MSRIFLTAIITLASICIWTAVSFVSYSEGWWKTPITESDTPEAFVEEVRRVVEAEHAGNFAMVLIDDGAIAGGFFHATGAPVDGGSVFQVASLGKWLTAWGVMAMVEDGHIDLDTPVSTYLTRWRLPNGAYDASGVTVRRLLSHTAGLDDGLGYDGFSTKAEVQSLEASLTRALDASPGKSGVISFGSAPGDEWRYSGGGYTILQLVVEEVSGLSFANFMEQRVFLPLGMTRTTFDHDRALQLGLAENFRLDGETEPFRWYSAQAASALFTTADDLAAFLLLQTGDGVNPALTRRSMEQISTPHASQLGADIWGLGAVLYAPNGRGGHVIGHDGKNEPAINTTARLDPMSGDGVVILETGDALLATELAGEWVFWKYGEVDNIAFASGLGGLLKRIVVGGGAILALGLASAFVRRTRRI